MYLSLVWHFHQPIYKDASNGEYVLPWVNFHATKSYYQMGELVRETGFPCAFNFVPCLLEQLMEYAAGTAKDPFQRALEKDPGALSFTDIELLRKIVPDESDPARVQAEALQAMFSPLQEAGEDRAGLLALQKEIHRDLIPLFKRLKKNGLVELFTSPYYHPLLPLVFDSHCPTAEKLPARRFRRPEDGRTQLKKGRDYFRKIFGFDPDGLWPSEGGISREVAAAVAEAGFSFALTDENVLWKSLKEPYDRKKLYRPYAAEGLTLFFRDRELSDLLGFEYKKWPATEAVSDFLRRLEDRRETISRGFHLCCHPGRRESLGVLSRERRAFPQGVLRPPPQGRGDDTRFPRRISEKPHSRPGAHPRPRHMAGRISRSGSATPPRTRPGTNSPRSGTDADPVKRSISPKVRTGSGGSANPTRRSSTVLFKSYLREALRRPGPGGAHERPLRFLFAVHNHQPVGNFGSRFRKGFRRLLRPFLNAVARHPAFKFAAPFLGPALGAHARNAGKSAGRWSKSWPGGARSSSWAAAFTSRSSASSPRRTGSARSG